MPNLVSTPIYRYLLVLFCLAGLLAQPERALCIGSDGHLAVELPFAPNEDCCTGTANAGAAPDAAWMDASCGPCVDMNLPQWTLAGSVKKDFVPWPTLHVSIAGHATHAREVDAGMPASPIHAVTLASSRTRSTVVIRC